MNRTFHVKPVAAVLGLFVLATSARSSLATEPAAGSAFDDSVTSFSLRADQPAEAETAYESTTVTTYEESESWDLSGPYFLRSADPEPAGEIELKLIFGYETESDGTDDDSEFEFVLEWGMTEDLHLIFEVPVEIGDGRVEGNADIETFGFHWRLWKEQGCIPAFAMRHTMRIPTGYRSDGVDYTARGLITKTIIPGKLRAHLNPYLKSVNTDNIEDARHFQWGVAAGVDCRITDNLLLIADYHHRSSEEYGHRNNHSLELGADWKIAEQHMLAFSTDIGLDGDSEGANWGFRISYIYSFGFVRLDAK